MSMLGAEQAGSTLAAIGRGQRPWRAAAAFSALTHTAQQQLRSAAEADGPAPWSMALAGLPRGLLRSALVAGRGSVAASRPLASGRAAIGLRELGNKLAAFEEFRYAERAVSSAAGFEAQVTACRQLPPFRALWVLEGLGHRHGTGGGGLSCHGFPAGELLPLHTGLGLALARRHLDALVASPSRRALEDWVEACQASSRPGYRQAVLEALGLITAGLAPTALLQIDGALAEHRPELRGAYWHGVGRGIYFSPRMLRPGSDAWTLEEALGLARRAAPGLASSDSEPLARDNVLAGLFWAVTLVNLTDPEVLASWIERVGEPIEKLGAGARAAVGDGICGALSLWLLFAGSDQLLRGFLDYRPTDQQAARRWCLWVREPMSSRMAQVDALEKAPEVLFTIAQGERPQGESA